ncbi:MAG: endo-1,4-beta-xylanase [Candidatus Rokubacteria bacterium]|nr:endo-1,4-beta-xylanase [Candidatus Rokubacteria bacterium]
MKRAVLRGLRAAGLGLRSPAGATGGGDTGGGWRAEADRRIRGHRMGEFAVTVHAPDGSRLAGAAVSARLRRHRFGFGTCVTPLLLAADEDGRRYREHVLDHFNMVVCENAMKWSAVERERGVERWEQADALLAFADREGLAMRGHCLFWGTRDAVRAQPWLDRLGAADLRAAVARRLRAAVERYRGRVVAWDVENELLDGGFYARRLGRDIVPWMFRAAREIDPAVPLFTNEYGILGSEAKLDRYRALIETLRAAGAPVGGIGIQEHAAQRFAPAGRRLGAPPALAPPEVWRRLDRLAAHGLPIHVTEVSSPTADEGRRADSLDTLFRVAFAHPAVEAILLWGFWAGAHWRGRHAALVDEDWEQLPAGARLADLLRREWSTSIEARADAGGVVRFRGFHGRYEVTADLAGGRGSAWIDLGPDHATAEARLARALASRTGGSGSASA